MQAPVVIATTTLYKRINELRFKLACKTIKIAHKTGYRVIMVDDSPDPEIGRKMRSLGAEVYRAQIPGLGAARRLAIFHALYHLKFNLSSHGTGIVFWTEPEKYDIIRSIHRIVEPIILHGKSVSIAKRSIKSQKTYPGFQIETEEKANTAYCQVAGRNGYDPMFGPLAFQNNAAQEFVFWNPVEFGAAEADGYAHILFPLTLPNEKVCSVEVDFHYPAEQKKEEAEDNEKVREKRIWQMKILIKAFYEVGKIFHPA